MVSIRITKSSFIKGFELIHIVIQSLTWRLAGIDIAYQQVDDQVQDIRNIKAL